MAAMQGMAPPGVVRACATRLAAVASPDPTLSRQTMSPDVLRQASDMMKNMSPEDMDRMMEMASNMRASGGFPGGGAAPGPGGAMPSAADLQGMLKNPEAMKMATEMMRSMKPEDLARMSQGAGMNMTPQQAEAVTQQLQNITPEQMAKIMAAAGVLQSAVARAKRARDWVLRNKALALALLILILSVLVRRWMARRSGRAATATQAPVEEESTLSATWS